MLNRAPLNAEPLNMNSYAGVMGVRQFTPTIDSGVQIDTSLLRYTTGILFSGSIDIDSSGLTQQTSKIVTGAVSTAGAMLSWLVNKLVIGVLDPATNIARQTNRVIEAVPTVLTTLQQFASVSVAGAVDVSAGTVRFTILASYTATVTITGTITRYTLTACAGALDIISALLRQTQRTVGSNLIISGYITTLLRLVTTCVGIITIPTTLQRKTSVTVTGEIDIIGDAVIQAQAVLRGHIVIIGQLAARARKLFVSHVTSVSYLVSRARITLRGGIDIVGITVFQATYRRLLLGSLTVIGQPVIWSHTTLRAWVSPTGRLARSLVVLLSASITAQGNASSFQRLFTTSSVSIAGLAVSTAMKVLLAILRPLSALDGFIAGHQREILGKILSQYTITGRRET